MSWQAKKNTNKGVMVNNERYTQKETIEDVLKYPFADFPERGVRKEILEKFGVRMSVSQVDGKTPTAIYFPYYDQKGKLSGFKKRDVTLPKDHDFHFTVVGRVAIDCKFFGQHVVENLPQKKTNLTIVEGEWDQLSYYQAAIDSVKGTGWAKLEPFAVSISMGTGNAVDCVLSNKEFTDSFEKVVISFDNDECNLAERKKKIMKGKEATVAVAVALMSNRVYTAPVPLPYKDANEMLLAGKGKEMVKHIKFDAKKFIGEKIVSTSDISLDEIMEDRIEGVYVNTFPVLMEKIHGFRVRELVVLTAPSNVGKSYVISEFAYSFLEAGEPVGFMMLEETKKETTQRMLARRLKVNYNVFKDKPTSVATEEQIFEAKQWLDKQCSCYMLDHFGSIPIQELMNKIKNFVFIHKCKYILLDHLSIVISGNHVTDERKELDMVMTELATFCAANDVCIIAVSHINRSNAADFKPAKDKQDEPFWVPVTKESMRGSAALEQLSWIVLGLEPQIMPDRSRGNVRLVVLKNRPWSYLGVADEFRMNQMTGLLECVRSSF